MGIPPPNRPKGGGGIIYDTTYSWQKLKTLLAAVASITLSANSRLILTPSIGWFLGRIFDAFNCASVWIFYLICF